MMRRRTSKAGLFRAMVLVWAGMWILAMPFFHVHPEADHHHGEEGHMHGAVVHTIWSPDLECEFDHQVEIEDTHDRFDGAVRGLEYRFHVGNQHAELSFTLLSDSSDRRQLLSSPVQPLTVASSMPWGPDRERRLGRPKNSWQRSLSALSESPSRAPPLSLI